jgi:hypothetical protein
MNTDEKTPDPMIGDIAGAADTPDAIEATSIRHDDPVVDPALNREHRVGRGVEWVRPTDLMARTGSRMAGAGIDFQADMARRSRHAATTSARALAVRARRLPPVSAFGRGHADRATTRDAVGIP